MKETTVSLALAVIAEEDVLPVRVQEALGELVGAARQGLLALSVGVGLGGATTRSRAAGIRPA